jgi:hypothetical protein
MEYRGIRYEIRARPGKNEWAWTVYAGGKIAHTGEITGTRRRVELTCQLVIDRMLQKSRSADPENDESDLRRSPRFDAGAPFV